MCTRFSLKASNDEIKTAYNAAIPESWIPDGNISITDDALIATADQPDVFQKMQFKLISFKAESPKSVTLATWNARSDNLMKSNLCRPLFLQHKRCIIMADMFYEKDHLLAPEEDQNYAFSIPDRPVFWFAGLWSKWVSNKPGDDPYYSFSIIMTESNDKVGEIHDKQRMPVILRNMEDTRLWLSKEIDPEFELLKLLVPYPNELMDRVKVSKFKRKVKA